VWRAAAILFLGLSAYFFVTGNQSTAQKKEIAKLQGEFTDLEVFYSSEIAEKITLIRRYDESQEVDQFAQDFQKLDAMYQVLKEQMKIEPTLKVRDALVLNLLVRIDLLNQQLHTLERIKTDSVEEDISI
jgi:type IV secretory pathway VirB10-like protein